MSKRVKEENPVMRADEVRELLKIGKNTLYEWCRQGIIPHRRIGHLLFFSRKAINELIENNYEGGIK